MTTRTVIRPRLSAVVYVLVALACVVAVVSLIVSGSLDAAGSVLPIPVLLVGVGYVTLLAPSVAFDAEAVEVRGPLRTTRVPYGRITDARTTHGFALVTDEGVVSAWAAPPPDRIATQRIVPSEAMRRDPRVRRDEGGDSLAASDAPGTPSGDAMTTLAHRLAEHDPSNDAITRSWNIVNITVLVASLFVAGAAAWSTTLV